MRPNLQIDAIHVEHPEWMPNGSHSPHCSNCGKCSCFADDTTYYKIFLDQKENRVCQKCFDPKEDMFKIAENKYRVCAHYHVQEKFVGLEFVCARCQNTIKLQSDTIACTQPFKTDFTFFVQEPEIRLIEVNVDDQWNTSFQIRNDWSNR